MAFVLFNAVMDYKTSPAALAVQPWRRMHMLGHSRVLRNEQVDRELMAKSLAAAEADKAVAVCVDLEAEFATLDYLLPAIAIVREVSPGMPVFVFGFGPPHECSVALARAMAEPGSWWSRKLEQYRQLQRAWAAEALPILARLADRVDGFCPSVYRLVSDGYVRDQLKLDPDEYWAAATETTIGFFRRLGRPCVACLMPRNVRTMEALTPAQMAGQVRTTRRLGADGAALFDSATLRPQFDYEPYAQAAVEGSR